MVVEAGILLEVRTDPLPSMCSSSISAFGVMLKVKFQKNAIVISVWRFNLLTCYKLDWNFSSYSRQLLLLRFDIIILLLNC